MDFEQCKREVSKEGVKVENLSPNVIKFLREKAFGDIGPGSAPDINSIDPAERVTAGIRNLDKYLADEKAKSLILDLISDAIEMNASDAVSDKDEADNG